MWFFFSVQDWSTFAVVCASPDQPSQLQQIVFVSCFTSAWNDVAIARTFTFPHICKCPFMIGRAAFRGQLASRHFEATCDCLYAFLILPCRSDLVQSFTEPLTAEDNTWRMGPVHLAASFRSIMPSSAAVRRGVCECRSAAADLGAGWIVLMGFFFREGSDSLKAFRWQRRESERADRLQRAKVSTAEGQSQATGSEVMG